MVLRDAFSNIFFTFQIHEFFPFFQVYALSQKIAKKHKISRRKKTATFSPKNALEL